jgi:hypothetical protein
MQSLNFFCAFLKNKQQCGHISLIILVVFFMWGCTGMSKIIWKSEPSIQKADNEYFEAKITPKSKFNEYPNWGYDKFLLEIKNKTAKNIELDWNKTLYIKNGQTSGGFMFEGILYMQRNDPKLPDFIFSNSSFSKIITPSVLVSWISSKDNSGWNSNIIDIGEHGVFLTMVVDGKEIQEKMVVVISSNGKQKLESSENTKQAPHIPM